MTPAVSIKNLTKYYRQFKAIDNISFDIEQGEFYGFLGPNGAGKTTTICALTGLANYQEGEITVFGHDVTREYRKTRALIGLVPQEFNFDPFLSAEDILSYEGGYFGMKRREAKSRAEELLKFFDLWAKRKDGYKKLSGGMKRRLLIARAIMHRPKILILDEPTAGVDLELRYHLWDFLRKLNKEGTTIILTTHYIEEAERLCNRIGVIHKGKIVATESKESLIKNISPDAIELFLKQDLFELPESLKGMTVELSEGGRKIVFEEKPGSVNAVLRALHDKNIEIERIDVRRPTLEDAFLKLTQKK